MKEIQLTKGKFALVDDEDFDFLNQWKWYAAKIQNTFYVARKKWNPGGVHKTFFMHREILGLNDNKIFVDHEDHNGLNNQRSNLRTCTSQQNQANQRPQRNTSSIYKGVSWDKQLNKWRACIRKNNKKIHIGYYEDETKAAIAFNEKAFELNGDFAYLNEVA